MAIPTIGVNSLIESSVERQERKLEILMSVSEVHIRSAFFLKSCYLAGKECP